MTKSNVELRTINYNDFSFDDESLNVSGYVNETGQLSEVLNDDGQEFVEIMQPGVFTNALATADFVDFYYEHDPEKVLATTQNGSLVLNEDNTGLNMSAKIVNTSWGTDAYQMIKSGVIKGMSFGMIVTQDSWDTSGALPVRTISQIELFEVSAVRFPAYPDSSIESRNIKSRVEARGMNLVKNTQIPKTKEVRDLDNESNNADLVNALNANTQAQATVADAMNSIAYTLNLAFNSSEDRSKKNDKSEESEERADDKKHDEKDTEEKAKETKSDDEAETESKEDSKKKSESDEAETKSEDKPDPEGDNKEQTELMSKDKEKEADEQRSKDEAAEAFRNFFKNRLEA